MVWTVDVTTTDQMADDWNNGISGIYTYYAKQPPADLGWNASIPLPTAIKIGEQIICNRKPEDYINPSTFTNVLYVDKDASGANNGSSWADAYAVINTAILAVESSGVSTRILVKSGLYDNDHATNPLLTTVYTTVDYSLEAVYGRVTITASSAKTWTLVGGNNYTYTTTGGQATDAYDVVNDVVYKHVGSIAEVEAEAGTFYATGTNNYTHRIDSSPVTNENTQMLRNFEAVSIGGTSKIFMRGFDMRGGQRGGIEFSGNPAETAPTITQSWLVADDCTVKFAAGGEFGAIDSYTGVNIYDCSFAGFWNCESSENTSDGFAGSDGALGLAPYILTVNCSGFKNGINSDKLSCNGITMHDGCTLVDIGGTWLGSVGTNAGHVNDGTTAWHFGSIAGDSTGDIYKTGGTLNWGAFGVWDGTAKMFLDCCRDVGSPIGVYSDGATTCTVRNHNGTGTKSGAVVVLPATNSDLNVTAD